MISVFESILLLYCFFVIAMSVYSLTKTSNKEPKFRYAGFWMRLIAAFMDGVITSLFLWVFGYGFGYSLAGKASVDEIQVAAGLLGILSLWIYNAAMESSKYQATLGKMILGLRVVDLDGGRISFGRATGRHFSKLISLLSLYIGFFMVGWTTRKQGLHDKLAGCLVVQVDREGVFVSNREDPHPLQKDNEGMAISRRNSLFPNPPTKSSERAESTKAFLQNDAVSQAAAGENDSSVERSVSPNGNQAALQSASSYICKMAHSQPNKTNKPTLEEIERTAKLAIEYDQAIATAWAELQDLPSEFQERFINDIGTHPDQDVNALVAQLKASNRKRLRPYDDEAANDVLEQVRTISADAEAEFRDVYAVLGNKVPVAELLSRVEAKFGFSEATKAMLEKERLERRERLKKERLERDWDNEKRGEQERLEIVRRNSLQVEDESQERKFWSTVIVVAIIVFLGLVLDSLY